MPHCPRCKKHFRTTQGVGLHRAHVREAKAKGRAERLCPEKRSPEEIREIQLRMVRLRAKLGLMGRHP